MNLIKQIANKMKGIEGRDREEIIYATVLDELEKGKKKKGLWAKAIADSEGDKDKIKSLYIKYRVQSFEDEIEIAENKIRDKEQRLQDAIDAKEQKRIDKLQEEDDEAEDEFLESLSHWELHGYSYIAWLTWLIYGSWVFSPTYEIASKIWIFILSLFGSYTNESGLIIFIILFLICLFEPPNRLAKVDRFLFFFLGEKKPTLKILIIGFVVHLVWGDRLLFDMAF